MVVSGAATDYPAAIEVAVIINGVQIGERIPVGPFGFISGVSSAFSFFSFSVSERVQQYFDMSKYWPVPGAPGAMADPSFVGLVELEIYTLYPNFATNVLEDAGTTEYSQKFPVINAWRRSDEEPRLVDYDASQATLPNLKFLTRKPNRSIVTLGDSEWLGLYTNGLFSYRIYAVQYDGTVQDGQLLTGATVFQTEEATILGVGPANINAVPGGSWLANTGPVVIDEDTRYYLVQAGWHCPDGNFVNFTTIRRYYLVPDSCQKHRVHFINSFGMPDSFSIFNNEQVQYLTESEQYTRALPSEFGIVDESLARVQAKGRMQISSPVGNITDEHAQWLAREFSMSPMVRVEEAGQYIPVVVKDGNFAVQDTEEPLDRITFTLEYSQAELSQRR